MAEERPDRYIVVPEGLLEEDNEPIKIVDEAVRSVWEARPVKRTPRQKAILRKRALEALEQWRARRREGEAP